MLSQPKIQDNLKYSALSGPSHNTPPVSGRPESMDAFTHGWIKNSHEDIQYDKRSDDDFSQIFIER